MSKGSPLNRNDNRLRTPEKKMEWGKMGIVTTN